ncbi:hypothetical protein J437_LFUL016586 [Ladona fulva]|uniref:Uncharacterized protein n=1 Tax=Ladona fulva TaxID=123851 RepID=A0A8K0KLY0_LADFU|nr:hypothetical protein J437_LFUL016586 [Ladona fulva]
MVLNPTALLSGTLRTYQRAGCEGEVVTLRCPQGTTISVQVAQYGRPPPSSPQHHSIASTTLYRPPPLCPGHAVASPKANATCHWPNALQDSIILSAVFLRKPFEPKIKRTFCENDVEKHSSSHCNGPRGSEFGILPLVIIRREEISNNNTVEIPDEKV